MARKRYKLLFQEQIGHPIFRATLSCNRFWFLMSNVRFDYKNIRERRFQSDRFAACRTLYEMFNTRCSSVLQPGEYKQLINPLWMP